MVDTHEQPAPTAPRPRYLWPWYVAAAALLGLLLAVLWMSREVSRTRQLRQWNAPAPATNPSPLRPSGARFPLHSGPFKAI